MDSLDKPDYLKLPTSNDSWTTGKRAAAVALKQTKRILFLINVIFHAKIWCTKDIIQIMRLHACSATLACLHSKQIQL